MSDSEDGYTFAQTPIYRKSIRNFARTNDSNDDEFTVVALADEGISQHILKMIFAILISANQTAFQNDLLEPDRADPVSTSLYFKV